MGRHRKRERREKRTVGESPLGREEGKSKKKKKEITQEKVSKWRDAISRNYAGPPLKGGNHRKKTKVRPTIR